MRVSARLRKTPDISGDSLTPAARNDLSKTDSWGLAIDSGGCDAGHFRGGIHNRIAREFWICERGHEQESLVLI
jgi:hypothetical protein